MVCFIRCNDIKPDPRLQKYIDFLENNHISYKVLAWDRMLIGFEDDERVIYYKKRCGFGNGIKNLIPKLLWIFFVFKNLYQNRKDYKIIHACDIDAALPAIVFKLLGKVIIFDIFDWIDYTKSKSAIIKVIMAIQNKVAIYSDFLIVCEEYRKIQLKLKHSNILVMPNIPEITLEPKERTLVHEKNTILKLGYVGVFDDNRGIETLLKIVSGNNQIQLHIAGFGKLQDLVTEYNKRFNNITYYGKVSHERGIEILKNCDLNVAFYFIEQCPSHVYAAPNKFYESLMLGIPLLTNEGTFFSERVEANDLGVVTLENSKSIEDALLKCLNEKDKLEEMGLNAYDLWKTKYSTLVSSFMNDIYLKIVNKE